MPLGTALQGFIAARQQGAQQDESELKQAGALQALLEHATKMRKTRAFEADMAGLPADATEEQRGAVAMRYATPDVVAKSQQDALNRKEQAKDRALQFMMSHDLKTQALEQQKDLALQRATDKAQQDAILNDFRARDQNLKAQQQQFMRYFQEQGLDIRRLQAEAAKEKDAAAKDKLLSTNTQKLSASLEKANLPEADSVLDAVEKALDKTPRLAEYLGGPLSMTPDMAIGVLTPGMTKAEADDIRAGKQAFQKLFNITLKNRSGSAVTNQELERLKSEFANGAFKTTEQLRAAVQQARNIISRHYASVAAGFSPDVLDSYNENMRQFGGRVVLTPQGSEPAAPKAAGTPAAAPALTPAEQTELDALRKKHGWR